MAESNVEVSLKADRFTDLPPDVARVRSHIFRLLPRRSKSIRASQKRRSIHGQFTSLWLDVHSMSHSVRATDPPSLRFVISPSRHAQRATARLPLRKATRSISPHIGDNFASERLFLSDVTVLCVYFRKFIGEKGLISTSKRRNARRSAIPWRPRRPPRS